MSAILQINDVGIDTLGLDLIGVEHVWSKPRRDREAAPLIGRLATRPALVWTTQTKVLRLTFALRSTVAARRVALDSVWRVLTGDVSLKWSDAPGRVQYGYVLSADVSERFGVRGYGYVDGDLEIMAEVALYTPLAYNVAAETVTLTAVAADCEVGTAPSYPLIELDGAIDAAVTITYKDHDDNTIYELSLANPEIGAGDKLVIDCARERIWTLSGTTYTSAMQLYTSGTFPVIRPVDAGDIASDEWPTLEVSHDGEATYHKAWE